MKKLILFFLLVLGPALVWAQKFETAKAGDKLKLDASETYLVQRDTSENGVITVTLTPSTQLQRELESKLGDVLSQLAEIDARAQVMQDQKKSLRQQQKELQSLLDKIPPPGKSAKQN